MGFRVLAALIFLIFQFPTILVTNLLTAATAAVCFFVLVLITRHKGMGMGDVKMAIQVGLTTGLPSVLVAMFVAFVGGGLVAISLLLVRRKRWKEGIPFGPFLALGAVVALFWGERLFTWYLGQMRIVA